MPRTVQEKNSEFVQAGWERVYRDADAALREAKARVRKLKRTMSIIEIKIKNKEPFPVATSERRR